MKKNKNSRVKKSGLVLLSAAVVLLAGSAIGSTRAALSARSEVYKARMETLHIGVSLVENGNVVASKNYTGSGEEEQSGKNEGTLLANTFVNEKGDAEALKLGKKYKEELVVQNTGGIDEYVRVRITKSWVNANNVKDTTLSPDLIQLDVNSEWIPGAKTTEREIYYYPSILTPNEKSEALTTAITVDSSVAKKVATETKVEGGKETTTTTYAYDGYSFKVTAEVDAVQTHNPEDAIKSAWGVDVSMNGDSIASVQ